MKFFRKNIIQENKGFALISSLSIMVLLMMLVIGMLSLAATETKSANNEKFQMEAQANARMALMIALGELQEAMGPDQRISATSNILDSDPTTDLVDDVRSQNVLGVWDSWNTYITDPLDASHPSAPGSTIQQSYVDGRSPLFRRWLVSHNDDNETEQWDSPRLGFKFADDVELVGAGSLGSNNVASYVKAGKIPVKGASGRDSGAYAWWVGGDNLKASISLEGDENYLSDSTPKGVSSQLENAALESYDPKASGEFNDFKDGERGKLLSQNQLGLVSNSVDDARSNFFDYGAAAQSLLIDVRRGGPKSDINSAFESDTLLPRFDSYSQGALVIDAPIREINGTIESYAAGLSNKNTYLPSWKQMRNYYRLYREIGPQSVSWDGTEPYSRRYLKINDVDNSSSKFMAGSEVEEYTRMPLIKGLSYVIGLSKKVEGGFNNYYVITVPVVSLWNPYNVELRIDPDKMGGVVAPEWVLRLGNKTYVDGVFQPTITRYNADGSAKKTAKQDKFGWDSFVSMPSANNQLKRIHFRGGDDDAESGDQILMKPGEMLSFSLEQNDIVGGVSYFKKGYVRGNEWEAGFASLAYKEPVAENSTITAALKLGGRAKAQRLYQHGVHKSSMMFLATSPHEEEDTDVYLKDGTSFVTPKWNLNSNAAKGTLYATGVNWFGENGSNEAQTQIVIAEDSAFGRAEWPSSPNTVVPVGIVGFEMKNASTYSVVQDYRNKNWLHAPLAEIHNILGAPNSVSRVSFPYTLKYQRLSGGNAEFGNALTVHDVKGVNYGRSFSGPDLNPNILDGGVSQIVTQELPTAPPTSLSDFATMRLRPAVVKSIDNSGLNGPSASNWWRATSHAGATFGVGIGNGYAHPMLAENEVFRVQSGSEWQQFAHTKNDNNADTEATFSDAASVDYWDQLFITNDALWDEWFCSSIVPSTNSGVIDDSAQTLLSNFLDGSETLSNQKFNPYIPNGYTDSTLLTELIADEDGDGVEDTWKKVASCMTLEGGFNVNSTSVEAWKALLYGLKSRKVPYTDVVSGGSGEINTADTVTISRHRWATGNTEASNPTDKSAWSGVRELTESQLDKLAQEIVHQVKLRGPFLNMSEFINRRVGDTADSRLNQASAMQAAIDWGEFENGYNGKGDTSSESINGIFKIGTDMISSPTAKFPNPAAARGSRYAGIPSYVMASDVLQAIGESLVPRCDTFTIRCYGESKDSRGVVKARVWCEAVVQRFPDYVDSGDKPWEAKSDLLGVDLVNSSSDGLNQNNKTYGRKMQILSFRWLSPNEV